MKLSNLFSNPLALAKYMFILLAALLVVLAYLSLGRLDVKDISGTIMYANYSMLMFVDGLIMLFFAFRIGGKNKRIYQAAVAFVALNIILTIFDQIGIVDVIFILLNGFTLYVLYVYGEDFTETAH